MTNYDILRLLPEYITNKGNCALHFFAWIADPLTLNIEKSEEEKIRMKGILYTADGKDSFDNKYNNGRL